MKTILKVAFSTIFIFTLLSCQDDDDSNNIVDKELNGVWNLDKTYGFYPNSAFIQHKKGEVVWEFNTSIKKLKVVNNLAEIVDVSSGNYMFYTSKEKLNENIEYKTLYIDNKKEGDFYKIQGDSLIVDYESNLDGHILVFKK